MSTPLLIAVTMAYAWVALEHAWKRDANTAIIYFGYALANVGLVRMVGGGK